MSHPEQVKFCKSVKALHSSYFSNALVVDIGSFDINGNNQYLFDDCLYMGVDLKPGRNVDFASTGHQLNLPEESIDFIVSTECFEHDQYYKKTLLNIIRMLKPGGMFVFTCATTGRPEHGTNRVNPEDAPFILDLGDWGDYYKNLEESDIREVIDVESIFDTFKFSTNEKSHDLYFWGIKKGNFLSRNDYSFQLRDDMHKNKIIELNQDVSGLNQVIIGLNQELSGQNQSMQATIGTRDSTIQERDLTIENRGLAIDKFAADIEELDAAIVEKNLLINLKIDTIDWLKGRFSSTELDVKSLRLEVASLDLELKKCQKRSSYFQDRTKYFESTLTSLMRSKSWRLTLPLRELVRWLSSPRNQVRRYYAVLPKQKAVKFKGLLFRHLPTVFKRTKAYRDWVVFSGNSQMLLNSGSKNVQCLDSSPFETQAKGEIFVDKTRKKVVPLVRLIAMYLPQFHPIPENNEWWGEGFTEWTNVRPSTPMFKEHYQPHIPEDLGYYDLRDINGIGGFCFYFYWFAGKRLLETPVKLFHENRDLDFPYCLCWANENWSRRWDGLDNDILIRQEHSAEDDLAFIEYISQYFEDERYIRVDGKPLLVVYRPALLPSPRATSDRWRSWCRDNGIGEIHLATTLSFEYCDPAEYGFDVAIEFPPNNAIPDVVHYPESVNKDFSGIIFDWDSMAKRSEKIAFPDFPVFRSVCTGWDNSARKKRKGTIFAGSTPKRFGRWLSNVIEETNSRSSGIDDNLVFVNAWNEWAEGAHLEPDRKYGYAYLEAARQALLGERFEEIDSSDLKSYPLYLSYDKHKPIAIVIHAYYVDVFKEILVYLDLISEINFKLYITSPVENIDEIAKLLNALDLPYVLIPVENKGRDVLPFLKALAVVLEAGHDTLVKVHTKKSLHREDGKTWLDDLLTGLLEEEAITKNLDLFDENPDVGILSLDEHIVPMNYYFGSNENWMRRLVYDFDISMDEVINMRFVAGTMFCAKTAALRPLLSLNITDADFEVEDGQIDGTLAHALERMISVAAHKRGYCISGISDLNANTQNYAYAEKHSL
jgi:lipopolysaccharide biosynthesis protein